MANRPHCFEGLGSELFKKAAAFPLLWMRDLKEIVMCLLGGILARFSRSQKRFGLLLSEQASTGSILFLGNCDFVDNFPV